MSKLEYKYFKDSENGTEEYGMEIKHPDGFTAFSYHREDGPAVIEEGEYEEWWYYGNIYKKPEKMPLNLFLAYVKWELKKHG